jgi:hypothetical protein
VSAGLLADMKALVPAGRPGALVSHRPAAREVVDRPAHPPQVEFLGERGERGVRIDRHLDL